MAVHAGARQTVVAQNMANADTPGYAAKDIAPFRSEMGSSTNQFVPKTTRSGHLIGGPSTTLHQTISRQDVVTAPNENSVSIESEMMHAVDAKRQHDRALAIYKSSLGVLRTAIGRR
jgi:flagellar basal-body rod protein FlgB